MILKDNLKFLICFLAFTCNGGKEIDRSQVCDGESDCMGGEDEDATMCGRMGSGGKHLRKKCKKKKSLLLEDKSRNHLFFLAHTFTCGDGTVIDDNKICDGNFDCPGEEDESGCGTKNL